MNKPTAIFALIALCCSVVVAADEGGPRFTELPGPGSTLVSFRIVLRAGSINDPAGKEGLNALTARCIANGGTTTLSYAEVVDKLYPWAAGVNVQTDQEVTTFIGTIHKDHLEKFYELFSGLLLHPRFDEADFQRVKDLALNYLQNTLRATNDEALGKQTLNALIFEGTPYARCEGGTVSGLSSITLDDVKKYYSAAYTRANLWIGVAGGYPPALIETMRKDFSALPAGTEARVSLPALRPVKDMEVTVVEKPTRAYAVSMGYPIDVTRKDKDFYALMVANSYFGEHRTFNGVLMNHLRGDRGLNYGDYSYIEKFVGGLGSPFPDLNTPLRRQYFSIWLRPVPPEQTHFAIRNALWELKKLVEQGLSQEDFENTRKFVINYSKLWAATTNRRLGYKMDSEFYQTGYFIDRIEKELKSMTREEVNAAIKKYLHPSDIKIAVVVNEGAGKQFLDELMANTPSPMTYSSPVPQRITDEDKEITVFPLKLNREKSKVISAKELFEK